MTPTTRSLDAIRNVLVVRWDRIGDLACCVPAIRALRQACPQATVTGLFSPANAPLLAGTGLVDDILLWDRSARWRARQLAVRRLKARAFDCVVLLVTAEDAYVMARVIGAPWRAGPVVSNRPVARALAEVCLTHCFMFDQDARVQSGERLVHEAEKAIGTVEAMGVRVADPSAHIELPADVRLACRHMVGPPQNKSDAGPLIAVPLCRRYAADGWQAGDISHMIDAILTAHASARVLVTFGSEEIADGTWMKDRYGSDRRVAIVGQPELQRWAGLMQMANVVVSINSAAIHLAASGGVPSVVLCPASLLAWRGDQEWHPWRVPYRQVTMERVNDTMPSVLHAIDELLGHPGEFTR